MLLSQIHVALFFIRGKYTCLGAIFVKVYAENILFRNLSFHQCLDSHIHLSAILPKATGQLKKKNRQIKRK